MYLQSNREKFHNSIAENVAAIGKFPYLRFTNFERVWQRLLSFAISEFAEVESPDRIINPESTMGFDLY